MIGIMSAMQEEISGLIGEMGPTAGVSEAGMRTYHAGALWGTPAVAVFSRWGKVAASSTATFLIANHGVDRIIFTGVAGSADPGVRVGDVVIARNLYQHDMDARPLFPRYEIPLLGTAAFSSTAALRRTALDAAQAFLADDLATCIPEDVLTAFGVTRPKAIEGDAASGDKFFASHEELRQLTRSLPVACVEMEGAAVAQVCFEYGVEFTVIRTISDTADSTAHIDFAAFANQVAAIYSHGIIRRMLAAA